MLLDIKGVRNVTEFSTAALLLCHSIHVTRVFDDSFVCYCRYRNDTSLRTTQADTVPASSNVLLTRKSGAWRHSFHASTAGVTDCYETHCQYIFYVITIFQTRNELQSLAYSPLGAVVSPTSEYLWQTLTDHHACLTAPPHSEHRWTKRGNNYRLQPCNFFRLKHPNLTKVSQDG